MRVLFVTQLLPYPLDSGSKIRNYYLLRHLSVRHRVTLASFIRANEELALAQEALPFCEAVHTVPLRRSRLRDVWHLGRSFVARQPFLVARDWSPRLFRLVQDLHREHAFDVVQVSPLTMAPYAAAPSGARRAVDCHDVMTNLAVRTGQALPWWVRPLARFEAHRLSRYEPDVVRRVDRALAVSECDRRSLESLGAPAGRLSVVPIGVDAEVPPVERRGGAPPVVLCLGGLNYVPNRDGLRWFLSEIFPRVLEQLPECRLNVVGRDAPQDVLDAAAHDHRITVAGRVRDVDPCLEEASLLAVPLRSGSGMRVKILEALARGVPVVTTALGCEGIDAEPGRDLLVADDPASFADAVVRLARDEVLARRLRENGRGLVKAKYDWRRVGEVLDAAYDRLCGGRVLSLPRAARPGVVS